MTNGTPRFFLLIVDDKYFDADDKYFETERVSFISRPYLSHSQSQLPFKMTPAIHILGTVPFPATSGGALTPMIPPMPPAPLPPAATWAHCRHLGIHLRCSRKGGHLSSSEDNYLSVITKFCNPLYVTQLTCGTHLCH
jgi:hypothetical protein